MPDDAALAGLLEAAFDFLCQRKVSELIDGERLLLALDASVTEPRVMRMIARFLAPARARLLERARASELALSVWLPEATRDALANLLGAPAPIPREIIDEVVTSERVREDVRAMLKETLESFIAKAVAVAPGGKGVKGLVGWGARAAGAASRGFLGGLGGEIQRLLEERVRDFVDSGVAMVQARLAQKLKSPETARLLGRRRRRAFLGLLKRSESEAARFLEKIPFAMLDALAPTVLVHNLARAEVRAALAAEIAAALGELEKQTIGELLDELGLREAARAALLHHGLPLARAFVAAPEFARWRKV
ncbi:MAG TPA: hypothetical protein VKN99_02860 [Polyangia bacterium]|nr:hypothetical protein [Polyangia bacterium]